VRDRLAELDTQRAAVLERLEQLRLEEVEAGLRTLGRSPRQLEADEALPPPSRRASPRLAGARIRWVGA
jgi:hypothetical protein